MDFVKVAFSEPLPLSIMVRLSFVVGGGKLCRQKYRDDLPKDLCAALSAVGFEENKAASCELSAGGSYKFQHDTSKNLKFVHVFPHVTPQLGEGQDAEDARGEGGGEERLDPLDVLAHCDDLDEFRRLVSTHVLGYAPKKRVLDALRERLTRLDSVEAKLIARETLDATEQALYDSLSIDGLKEKVGVLGGELQAVIEAGNLTAEERTQVVQMLDSKLAGLDADVAKAEAKEKLRVKLEEQREKVRATRKAVFNAEAVLPPPLRHAEEIRRLRSKLSQLQRLEKVSGQFTLDDLKRLAEKPELEEAIAILENRSRIWLETDEEFQHRLQLCLKDGPPPKGRGSAAGTNGKRSDGFAVVESRRR